MRLTIGTAGLAMATLLALAACGGGGGDDSPGSDQPITTPPVASADTVNSARAANSKVIVDTTSQAAKTLPQLGGLVQVAAVNVASASSISTSFDGAELNLSVSRTDGSALSLNTVRDTYIGPFALTSPIDGHTARDWGVAQVDGSGISVARALVSWDSGDPADYLAGGYWMHLAGDVNDLDFTGIEIGAFVDGPELSFTTPANLPVQGSASYYGPTAGIYGVVYGNDTLATPGSVEIGEFASTVELNVDFGAGSIGGCIGCTDPIVLAGVFEDAATGEVSPFHVEDSGYWVMLGTTTFGSDASFSGQQLTLNHPDIAITGTRGAWGGRFSNIPDSAGDPRLIAGTFGAEATTAGGSEGAFLGAFVGAGQ